MATYTEIVAQHGTMLNRMVGIEMEGESERYRDGLNDDLPSGWEAKEDGSLDEYEGVEITTPPMLNLSEVYCGWEIMQDAGFRFTSDAGTHVHVDMTGMTALDVVKIMYFTAKVENVLFALVDDYRYHNTYCGLHKGKGWEQVLDHLSYGDVPNLLAGNHRNANQVALELIGRRNLQFGDNPKADAPLRDYLLPYSWIRIKTNTLEYRLFNCVGNDDTGGDMAIAFGLLAHNITEMCKNASVEQVKFIVNEIMSAGNVMQAVERLCQSVNLLPYPIRGEYVIHALERDLSEYRRTAAMEVAR